MNVFERSLAYIARKKIRTSIILLILVLIASSIYACLSVIQASNNLEKRILKASNSSLSIVKKTDAGKLGIEDVKKIAAQNKIIRVNYKNSTDVRLENGQVIKANQKIQIDNPSEKLNNLLKMHSMADSRLENVFTSESFVLKKGRHIKESDQNRKVLIHEKLAEKNRLKVGDKISLAAINNSKKMNFEIVGIFTGKAQENFNGLSSDLSENTIFTDFISGSKLLDNQLTSVSLGKSSKTHNETSAHENKTSTPVEQATFFLNQPEKIKQVVAEIKKYPLNWSGLEITENTKAFESIAAAAKTMKEIIGLMTVGIAASGVIALSLVLVLWLRERIYEIGILLAIGQAKIKIFGQFICELVLISVPAIIITVFLGGLLSSQLLSSLLAGDDLSELNGKLAINLLSGESLVNLIYSCLILFAVIVVSVSLTSVGILFQKPKKILSKIS